MQKSVLSFEILSEIGALREKYLIVAARDRKPRGADQTDAFARRGNEIGVSVEQSRPAHQREVEKSKHERGGAF